MGMIGTYYAVTPDELDGLLAEPETSADFLFGDSQRNQLDIDKTWHAIHFLLNGQTWEGTLPLFNAVLGGTVLGEVDLGYGPPRYLTPEEVRETARALSLIPRDELEKRYSAQELNAAEIYPSWSDTPDDIDYIGQYYESLVKYFDVASKRGDAMILLIN